MISSTKTLPDGYQQASEINLSKNKGLSILLNLAGTLLFVLGLVPLGAFSRWARPEFSVTVFKLGIGDFVGVFASILLTMLLHELIHGFFFWIFTHSRPVFALRLLYAYAAAPDWFIPARHYWIIGLAPLVLIGVLGLLSIFVVSLGWVLLLDFLIALNTAGAIGDLFIVARLWRLSPASLVNDSGDRIRFFESWEKT